MVTSLEMLPVGTEQLSSEEEGEIIELDDDDHVDIEFGYRIPASASATAAIDFEDISSDEELNLRQRIEELEARNQELEQIAAITKTSDDFAAPSSRSTATADFEYIDLVEGDSSPDRQLNKRHNRHHNQSHYQYHAQYPDHSHTTHHQPRHRKTGNAVDPPARRSSASDTIASGHRSRQHSNRQRQTASHRTTTHRHHDDEPMDGASSRYDNVDIKHHRRRRRSLEMCPNDSVVVDQHLSQKKSHSDRTERPDPRLSYTAAREARTQQQQQRNPHKQRHREPLRKQRAHRHNGLRTRSRSSSASSSSSSSSSASSSSSSSASSTNSISAALHGTPYRPHRNVLRAAVKREPVGSGTSMTRQPLSPATSSLQRKLMGIQQSVTQYIADGVADIVEETEVTASIEIMQLLDTLTNERIIDDKSEESKRSGDKKATPIGDENTKSQPQLEAISLEEQELRLVALKSAILKKHEARKRRKVLEARPYSPTDTDIVLDSHGPTANRVTVAVTASVDAVDSILIDLINESSNVYDDANEEPLNMEISPAQSPSAMITPWLLSVDANGQTENVAVADKILQPIDMELSDGSVSPEYPLDEEDEMEDATNAPLTSTRWIPLPPDVCLNGATTPPNDIRSFGIFRQQQHLEIPPPPPPLDKSVLAAAKLATSLQHIEDAASLPFDDEEEAALRALLLSTKAKRKPVAAASVVASVPVVASVIDRHVKTVDATADDDADQLRSIAMQSLAMRAQQSSQPALTATTTTSLYDVSQKENNINDKAAKQCISTPILIKTIPNNILIDTNRQPVANITSVSASESTDRTCRNRSSSSIPKIEPTITNTVAPVQPHVAPIVSPTKAAAIALKRKAIAIANVARKRANTATIPAVPAIRKGSALITHMHVKPVRPLIIRFTHASDSDSDEWAASSGGFYHGGGGSNTATSSLDRFFDPASPASCVMDPAVIDDGVSSNSNGPMPAAGRSRPMFEQKVDEYLRMVRRKIQHSEPAAPTTTPDVNGEDNASTTTTTAAVSPSAKLLTVPTKPTKMMVTTKTGPATPLVVRHLPLSSQAEYKQLVLRMSMLEQKRAKQQQSAKQPAGREQIIGDRTKPNVVARSLIKQVLLKNGTDAMAGHTAGTQPPITDPDNQIGIDQDNSSESKTSVFPAVEALELTSDAAAAEAAKAAELATKELLRTTETSYQAQSQHLRTGLEQQQQRLVHTIKVRTKQLLLERQRKRLQLQLQRVERDLLAERTAYKELCPRIVAAYHEMRAERLECVQLAQRCTALARRAGDDDTTVVYTIPNDAMAQIELGFAQINEQTQRLKALRSDTVVSPTPVHPVGAPLPTSTHVKETDVIPTAAVATGPEKGVVTPIPKTIDDPVSDAANQEPAAKVLSSSDAGVVAAIDVQPFSPPSTTTKKDAVEIAAMDDVLPNAPLSINKYQSPLDHISTHSSSVNPDVVLCPFELQGRCDDRECAYQHLSVVRD